MGKADIHIHTTHSDGLGTVAQVLEFAEHQTDLDLLAITDHDMFDGADEARNLAARRNYRVQVIAGMEVTTLEGHLLALRLQKPIRSLQPLDKTIAQIHEQGGIAIVPHPMSWMIRSVGRNGLLRIHNHPDDLIHFDGVETLNPSLAGKVTDQRVREINARVLHLPETGGSDSHILQTIGTAVTEFPGKTADDFFRALAAKQTVAGGHYWTREELKMLARIGPEQMFKSLVMLPVKHFRRVVHSMRKNGTRNT